MVPTLPGSCTSSSSRWKRAGGGALGAGVGTIASAPMSAGSVDTSAKSAALTAMTSRAGIGAISAAMRGSCARDSTTSSVSGIPMRAW